MDFNKRLQIQKSEIEERNEMISNLQKSFEDLKISYQTEKQESMEKTRVINQQRENIDRLNARVRSLQSE
jgi:hypothetical protein